MRVWQSPWGIAYNLKTLVFVGPPDSHYPSAPTREFKDFPIRFEGEQMQLIQAPYRRDGTGGDELEKWHAELMEAWKKSIGVL